MKTKLLSLKNFLSVFLLICFFNSNSQTLDQNFKNPPASAKPRTWMHAMSANMSKYKSTDRLEPSGLLGPVKISVSKIVLFSN